MPPERQISYKEVQSRSVEANTAESARFNEVQDVAATILQQRAQEVLSRMDKAKGPQTDQENAYYFFQAVNDLPPRPKPGDGTPLPQNESEAPDAKQKPLKLRIVTKPGPDGKPVMSVAQNQDGQGGQTIELKALQYREGDIVYFTASSIKSSGMRENVNIALPVSDLLLAQMNSEQDVILKDEGLSTDQRGLLELAQKSFREGQSATRDASAADKLAEGARSSGLLSRSSIEKFIAAKGAIVPPEKLDRILGKNTIAKPNQVVEIMDAAGFFDKNQLKVMVQDAERAASSAQAAVTAAETKVAGLQQFEGKTAGDKIQDEAGAEIEVTQEQIDSLTTAKTELAALQKAAKEAVDELMELKNTEVGAADPRIRGEMENYMKRIQNGEVDADSGLAFVRAVETNDPEGIFNAVMEEELKKIEDKKTRDLKRQELQEKYKKYNERALRVGGIALMVLLMMMKDSAKG